MKTYKCPRCKLPKTENTFYCKPCNTEICLFNKYKRWARQNPKAFAEKIRRKDTQLGQMLKALREVQI